QHYAGVSAIATGSALAANGGNTRRPGAGATTAADRLRHDADRRIADGADIARILDFGRIAIGIIGATAGPTDRQHAAGHAGSTATAADRLRDDAMCRIAGGGNRADILDTGR